MSNPSPPRPGSVLGVWAHPDDEAYLSAGLMSAAVRAGHHVTCLTATKGEHGTPHPREWPPARLGLRRTHEMAAAMAVIGVTDHRFLGYFDGQCAAVDPEVATARVAAVIEEIQPDTIVSFGPDGMTGHPDHISVSNWTTAAWRQTGSSAELLHARMTPERMAQHGDGFYEHKLFPPPLPVVATDEDRVVELPLTSDEQDRKLAMLACHSSQTVTFLESIGEETIRAMWDVETFVAVESEPRDADRLVGAGQEP